MENLAKEIYKKRLECLSSKISIGKYKKFLKQCEDELVKLCKEDFTSDYWNYQGYVSTGIYKEEEDWEEYKACLIHWLLSNGFNIKEIEEKTIIFF